MNVRSRNRAKSWRDQLAVHPAAAMFPPLSDSELADMAADIKANGLVHKPVWFSDFDNGGKLTLLDGRCRSDAMEKLGWRLIMPDGSPNPDYLAEAPTWAQQHPYRYVASVNAHRRHLGPAQKRAMLELLFKADPHLPAREAARLTQVSPMTAVKARAKLVTAGVVSKVDTIVDSRGHRQPAHRRPKDQPVTRESIAILGNALRSAVDSITEIDLHNAGAIVDVREFLAAAQRMMRKPSADTFIALPDDQRKRLRDVLDALGDWRKR